MKAKPKVIKNWEFENLNRQELQLNTADWMQGYGSPQRG